MSSVLGPLPDVDEEFAAPPTADEWRALAVSMAVALGEFEGQGRSGADVIEAGLAVLRSAPETPLLPRLN